MANHGTEKSPGNHRTAGLHRVILLASFVLLVFLFHTFAAAKVDSHVERYILIINTSRDEESEPVIPPLTDAIKILWTDSKGSHVKDIAVENKTAGTSKKAKSSSTPFACAVVNSPSYLHAAESVVPADTAHT